MDSQAESAMRLAQWLQPIPGDSPCGPDLRTSATNKSFAKLQAVLKEDKRYQYHAAFEKKEGQPAQDAGAPANWADVGQQASDILIGESKDLEVAMWLARALVKTAGVDGLHDAMALVHGLHERFGAALHPTDSDARKSRLEGLDQQLALDLRAAMPAVETLEPRQLAALSHTLSSEATTLAKIMADLKVHYSEDPPSFSAIRRAVELLASSVADALKARPADEPAVSNPETAAASAAPPSLPRGGPRNRDEALRALEAVAAYFTAAEPLSPVPHLLRRAIRWARGSLQQWLDEMVAKDDLLDGIYKTLDMTKPEPKQ